MAHHYWPLYPAVALMLALCATPAAAGDDLSSCCRDLESRIEELEAVAVAKGTSLVTLEVSGHVHRALMFWNDEHVRNTYIIDPTNWGSFMQFKGEAEFEEKWEAGFLISVEYPVGESISLSQNEPSSSRAAVIGRSSWFLSHEDWGKLSLGLETEAHDHITESDLSGTGLFAGAAVTDWNGSFFVRGPASRKGFQDSLTWGSLSSASIGDGENATVARFEWPELNGFKAAVSWGEGGVAAMSANYSNDGESFEIEAGMALAHYGDALRSPCVALEPVGNCATAAGSVSVLHKDSMVSLSGAGGVIIDDSRDGLGASPGHDYWLYAKLAQEWTLTDLGATTIYGEYFNGRHDGEITRLVTAGGGLPSAQFSALTDVVGAGIMQSIDEAEMQVYLAGRSYSVSGNAALGPAGQRERLQFDGFQAIMAGTRISF